MSACWKLVCRVNASCDDAGVVGTVDTEESIGAVVVNGGRDG